jgi:hypothetical protein
MKWVTRERPRIDRVACAWLIKRFVDPQPEFIFVPNDQVFVVAEREDATPFHVRGGKLGRTPEETGFDAIMRFYELGREDPALQRLAQIVHGADVFGADAPVESAGLRAVMNGYVDVFADDQELLNVAVTCTRHCTSGAGASADRASRVTRAHSQVMSTRSRMPTAT